MVLIDLQKAFDTVDHNILCEKLRTMGVDPVDWFHSYLANRQQVVDVNGCFSDSFYYLFLAVYPKAAS